MPASQSEIEQMWKDAVGLYAKTYIAGVSATDNLNDLTETAIDNVRGEYGAGVSEGARSLRTQFSRLLEPAPLQARLSRVLRAELTRIGSSQGIADSLAPLGDLHRNFVDNSRTVKRRAITRGSASASGATGDGPFYRLTDNFRDEPLQAEPKVTGYTFRCVQDSKSTQVGREVFEGESDTAIGLDYLTDARDIPTPITTQVQNAFTAGLLQNPSWDATGSTTNVLPNWTDSSGAAITSSTSNLARIAGDGTVGGTGTNATACREVRVNSTTGYVEVTTGSAVTFQQRITPNVNEPHVVGVWLRKVGTPTSNVTISFGGRTRVIGGGTLTTSWVFYALDDREWWPDRWQRDSSGGLIASITVADPTSTNEIHVDSFTVAPLTEVNRTWLYIGAGATPWEEEDEVAWTDSETVDPNSLQHAAARAYRQSLPSVPTATQVTASGGRTLTFSTGPDVVTASSGDFTSEDFTVGATLTVAGTSSNNGTYIITAVTATTITVGSTFTAEGPLSATATLNAASSIADPTVT